MQTVDVAAYMRVSTTEQRGKYGIPVQAQAIRAFVEQQDAWCLVQSWEDIGESGSTHFRPGLEALLADISLGGVKHVLVHRLDRLGRTEAAIWRCIWQIEDVGAQVECCTEPLGEPGVERWLTVDRLAQSVEADYRRIVARTQSGRQLKAVNGGWPGGPAPYGYRIRGKGTFGSTLEVDPAEAGVVKLLADLVIDGGRTLVGIAKELNSRGILTRSGKPWTGTNLHRRLRGATFLGEAVFRRTDRQWGGHRTRLGSDGRPLHGESVVIPLPPILPAHRIRSFQEALAALTRPRKNPIGEYLLSGLIHGHCGRPYIGCFRSKDGLRTYRCSGWNADVSCGCVFLPADLVEEEVASHLNALLASIPPNSRPMMPLFSLAHTQLIQHLERVRSLERLAARCAEELDTLRVKTQQDRVIAAAMRQLESEQKAFDRILAYARDWLSELHNLSSKDARTTAVLEAAAPDIRSLSSSEQRRLFESVKVRVDIVDPTFRYREGTRCWTTRWHQRKGTSVPADPTDSQWSRIEELLRCRYPAHHFRSPLDLRAAFLGMLHRLRSGILWRDLPECFGDPEKVRCRQRTWLADGVWAEIVTLLNEEGEGTPVLSDEAGPALAISTGLDVEVLR
ncbi:recombinase family protein [Streptomyces sp. CB01373]|uniref:recombinase family protein n=1 Tax=Streptomyces sp. CB01373 TaxID=2020325 RepID=UPI00131B7FD7|nr:recombinase family protein [Streptomyces sp. CB01373]